MLRPLYTDDTAGEKPRPYGKDASMALANDYDRHNATDPAWMANIDTIIARAEQLIGTAGWTLYTHVYDDDSVVIVAERPEIFESIVIDIDTGEWAWFWLGEYAPLGTRHLDGDVYAQGPSIDAHPVEVARAIAASLGSIGRGNG